MKKVKQEKPHETPRPDPRELRMAGRRMTGRRVTPEGIVVSGSLKRIPKCPTCGSPGVRDELHDAYGCRACNVWLEERCDDVECRYCVSRPSKPWEWAC